MTRRERMERRLARREEWAGKATAAAGQNFTAARRALDGIEPGQPILVGHHSERHHRRAIERADAKMAAGVERSKMAERHAAVAATLEDRLDRSIFSDDRDAVEQLRARIAEREAEAARIKTLTAAIRKEKRAGLADGWLDRIGATEQERRAIARNVEFDWRHEPEFPGYVLSNLRGRINADRERLATIERQQAAQAEAEAAPGGIVYKDHGGTWCSVRFADKPARDVLDALKAAGFRWAGGAWVGAADRVPEPVKSLISAASGVVI